MTEIQEITVSIAPDGKVDIEVHGVSGPACEALTAQLEQRLGGKVLDRRHKDSYYQTSDQGQDDSLTQGA